MTDAYAPNKLAAHPEVLADLRAGGDGRLISVHLMPTNRCPHSCAWCSYRLDDNHNSEAFDDTKQIPAEKMLELLADFAVMGVKGVEVTGGGEPLSYKHREELWKALRAHNFDTALVTNGTLLTPSLALLIGSTNLKWVRVSIDAADPNTYAQARGVKPSEFHRAWKAVELFRSHGPTNQEFRLGVGFVLSNENWREVYDFVAMAKEHGADNVRLSATFSDKHMSYFWPSVDLKAAEEASIRAQEDFEDDGFTVYNQIPRRLSEIEHPAQDYDRCATKDLLCVVEGEGKVYTCCTFTGSNKGLYGNFLTHPRGFRGVWEDNAEWRRKFNARDYCRVSCLYRERNLAMIDLIAAPTMPPKQDHIHESFI